MMLSAGEADAFLSRRQGKGPGLILLNSRCGNNSLQTIGNLLTPLALKSVSFNTTDFEAHVRNLLVFHLTLLQNLRWCYF